MRINNLYMYFCVQGTFIAKTSGTTADGGDKWRQIEIMRLAHTFAMLFSSSILHNILVLVNDYPT